MEVKSFSWTAIFIILAIVVVGMQVSNYFTAYNTYDNGGRKTGTQKPTAQVPGVTTKKAA